MHIFHMFGPSTAFHNVVLAPFTCILSTIRSRLHLHFHTNNINLNLLATWYMTVDYHVNMLTFNSFDLNGNFLTPALQIVYFVSD